MRIGIFGGTFDPVHLGHVIIAEQAREQSHLDQVWFVPGCSAAATEFERADHAVRSTRRKCSNSR